MGEPPLYTTMPADRLTACNYYKGYVRIGLLDMKLVLTGLMPSYNHVPRRFLIAAWPSLDMRNLDDSNVIGSLNK